MPDPQPSLKNLLTSYARVGVPLAVGWTISLALRHGLDLTSYAPLITTTVTFVYYVAARALEHFVSGRFGWLLGVPSKPKYKV